MSNGKGSRAPIAMVGIFAAFMFAVVWMVAVFADGSWSFGVDELSDLGISDVCNAANIFNYGCMLFGILIAVFGAGKIAIRYGHDISTGILLVLAGAFLVLAAIYTKDSYDLHMFFVYMFVLMMGLAAVVNAIGDFRKGKNLFAAIGSMLVVVTIGGYAVGGLAGLESAGAVCLIVWMAAAGASIVASKD